MSESHFYRG